MNYVILAGNLTRDPETRVLRSGTSVAKLRLAVNEVHKDAQGKKVENTVYVDLEAWGATAENCGRSLKKGSPVIVEGRLQLDQWETKEGQKRTRLLVRAHRVDLLSASRKGGAETGERMTETEGPSPFDEGAKEETEMPSAE